MSLHIGMRKDEDDGLKECKTIFRLIGKNEDALTYALGYVFSKDSAFLIAFLRKVGALERIRGRSYVTEFANPRITLQESRDRQGGRKDITIETNNYRIVIEAKIDGSVPDPRQIAKYTLTTGNDNNIDAAFITREWGRFNNRHLIVLTTVPCETTYYQGLQGDIDNRQVCIKIATAVWADILGLARAHYATHLKSGYICDLITFIQEDYKMKYYKDEVILPHLVLNKTYNMAMMDPQGFYFCGRPTSPQGLFFLPCRQVGGSRTPRNLSQCECLRRIEHYYVCSAEEIRNSDNKDLQQAFAKHCVWHSIDANKHHIHVYILSTKIPVPTTKQKFMHKLTLSLEDVLV